MLIAASPVEIDAEAVAAGLPPTFHDAARHLFHILTDRLGQAVVELSVGELSVGHETWPKHRFYFSPNEAKLAPLLAGLQARPDIVDVTDGIPANPPPVIAGLFCRGDAEGCSAILVGHESHEGYSSPHRQT